MSPSLHPTDELEESRRINVADLLEACIFATDEVQSIPQPALNDASENTVREQIQAKMRQCILKQFPDVTIRTPNSFSNLHRLSEEHEQHGNGEPNVTPKLMKLDCPSHFQSVPLHRVFVVLEGGTCRGAPLAMAAIISNDRLAGGVISSSETHRPPFYGLDDAGIVDMPSDYGAREAKSGMIVSVLRSVNSAEITAAITELGASEILEHDHSTDAMMSVASGKADLCFLTTRDDILSTCALQALVIANGGSVTNLFGSPLHYEKELKEVHAFGLLASSKSIAQFDKSRRTHVAITKVLRGAKLLNSKLSNTGLIVDEDPQATDLALDLDGSPITRDWLSKVIGAEVSKFRVDEDSAVRYLMSNACRLSLTYVDESKTKPDAPRSLFMKRIVMQDLAHVKLKAATAPHKIARDIGSYRVESAFLSSRACRDFSCASTRIVKPFYIDARPYKDRDAINSRFFSLLEDFSPEDGWFQQGLLDKRFLSAAIRSLASFHAFFWSKSTGEQDNSALTGVWDQGTYWLPSRQAANCFEQIEPSWELLRKRFGEHWSNIPFAEEDVIDLETFGKVLSAHAPVCAEKVHQVGLDKNHPQRTLLHGDAKAANLFFRLKTADGSTENSEHVEVGMIDFQWCGWGHPAVDVAYLIAASAAPELVSADGRLEHMWLESYYTHLITEMVRFGKTRTLEEARELMPYGDLVTYYNDALIDLARAVVSYHWVRIKASAEVLKERQDILQTNAYNKNMESAKWLVGRTATSLLHRLQDEVALCGKQ